MTHYTIAYVDGALLAVIPEGEDIYARIRAVEDETGEDFDNPIVVHDCLLTDDPSPNDCIVFASPNGCCGFIIGREGDAAVIYDYAVAAQHAE